MAKKRRLEEILAQREKTKQNTSNSGNVRQISTGLPTTRQQMVMPRSTTTEVQALAQSLYNRRSDMTAQQQRVANVAQNYTPIKQNGLAPSNDDKNKELVKKAVANYNSNYRQTGVISNDNLDKESFLNKVKQETDPKKQQEKLQQYNSLFHEDKNINQIRKEVKDAETVNKINNGTTAEKVFNTVKFLGQGMAEGAFGALSDINLALSSINNRDKLYGGYKEIEKMNESSKIYQQSLQNVDNKLIQFGGQVTNTVGAMLPSIGMNIIAPGSGALMSGVSSGSSEYLATLHENEDNKGKAIITGILKGTLAGTIEKIIGGNKIGTGALDDIAVKNIAKVKSQLAQKLLSKGYEVVGEVGEENLENLAGYLIDMAVNNKKVTVEDAVRDLIDTTGTTAGATLLLNALGLGGGTFNDVQIETNKNNQIKNSGLTQNQQQKLTEVAEKYNLSQADIQNLIDNTKNGKYDQNQATTMENKAISNQSQQTIQQEGKKAKNQMSNKTMGNAKYSIKMPNSNYKFNKTGNINNDNLDSDMSKYFNNSSETQKLNKTLKTIMKDKGIAIRFDENVSDANGNIVDGKYENGTITINPNSSKAFEYVTTHELTHAIGTKQMLDMVQKYRQSNKEFNSKVETLLQNYNATELTEEALADVSAELFGTQEFIANVKNTNPNLFQKIYNEIKYLWHQFRGYKNQNEFIEDLYHKWTKAYNSNAELNQTEKYLFGGEKALLHNKEKLARAMQMEKQNETAENIWIETGWFKGLDGKWKFEIDDSKMDIKPNVIKPNEVFLLKDILDADELFNNYSKELKELKIRFGKGDKGDLGSFSPGEIWINNDLISTQDYRTWKLLGLHNEPQVFSTLMHEIQHYIQRNEGFARGATIDLWSERITSEKRNKIVELEKGIISKFGRSKETDELIYQLENLKTPLKEIKVFENVLKKEDITQEEYDSINDAIKRKQEELDNKKADLEKKVGKETVEKFLDLIQIDVEKMAEIYYKKTAGELESRNVQSRIDYPPELKKKRIPFYLSEEFVLVEDDENLMYNSNKGDDKNGILLGRNNKIVEEGRQGKSFRKRNGRNNDESRSLQSSKEIYRTIEGNNNNEGNKLSRSNRNIEYLDSTKGLEESSSFNLQKNKEKQLEIILKNNPMHDDYHTGIRTIDDIKTYQEALNDDLDGEIQNLTPDFKANDLRKALETGEVTVYSSYPIEQGVFVTPSKMEAGSYAGNINKVYSKKIKLSDVAWIDTLQGQYAKVEKNNDTKYSTSSEDNKGRTLSKEQQEYFKDSKVRDENGNLIEVYHGTKNSDFTIFDRNKFNTNEPRGDYVGEGFFFHKDINKAKSYGNEIKKAYLNIKNPLIINNEQDGEKFRQQFDELYNPTDETEKQFKAMIPGYSYFALMEQNPSIIREYLEKQGYDGLIDNDYGQYAVFNSNQIKNVDNTNPTENPDIRYSKQGNIEWYDYVEKQFKTEGTRTTGEQIKADKYVTDNNGKVLELYHGSPDANITNFESKKSRFGKNGLDVEGIFFTNNPNVADEYSNETKLSNRIGRFGSDVYENTGKKGKVYKANLKMNKPFDLRNASIDEIMKYYKGELTPNEAKNLVQQLLQYNNHEMIRKDLDFRKMQADGYDGYIDIMSTSDPDTLEYLVFDGKQVDLIQPKKVSEVLKPKKKVSEVLPKQEVTTTQAEKRQLVDEVYREDIAEGKVRKHYKSVFDSDQVGDVGKDVAKELLKKDTYVPVSNLETITLVNDNISRNGIGATYNAFRTKVRSNEKITLQDVATGERLIQIYSQKGDYEKVNELIQDVAILGTELGQQVQALSLIKRASPEGQLQYLTKLLERTNIKENTNIKITDEMTEKILGAKNQEDLEKKLTEVAVELAEQLPVSKGDMIRSWRYLSMLGNPKTHIKNLGANVAMNLTQRAKNAVAGAIEGVASVFNPEMERTKTIKFANREQKQFAKQDAELMKDLIDAGGKYDVKNVIQESKKQFNNKVLNAIAEFNSNLLDKEDKIFLKSAYKMAMQNYMSANNLKASDMEGKTLEKARQYASLQAQEATFHEFNEVAQHLSQIENKGGLVGGAMSAILPFKKTPMNIAKAGVQYSPIGLASAVTYDIAQIAKKTKTFKQQLADGKITEAEYKSETSKMVNKTIDNMAKGLTGTSLAVLGYALAKMGVLKAGNDGEDDEFKQKLGEQEYAITIGDNTYTLDWVSPSAIPMFTGASIYQLMTGDVEDQKSVLNSTLTAFSKTFEPMTDMSMLQGLTSAITSYEQGSSNMIFDLGASMVTSYAGQFVPTVAGQVARIADPYERDTSSTKKGIEGKVDKFAKQTMNKIPGLSQKLPKKTDIWGEDVKRPENLVQRTLETAVLPWTRKKLTEDRTAQELLKVFDESGENVLPGTPNKDLTINKIKYRLSTEEYNEAKRNFGQTSKALLDDLFSSKTYNTLTAEGKAKAIDDVYAYAKEKIKVEYAEDNNYPVKPTNLYNTISSLEENNADVSAYFEFKGKIDDLDREKGEESVKNKEKMSYLKEMKTDAKTKRIIYEDTLGTNDEVYQNLSKLTGNKVNINQYLDYKTAEIKGIDDPKSIVKGKTKSGSKKANLQKYLRESNFSEVEALYIYGTQNSLNSTQRVQITNYINKAKQAGRLTASEEKEIYKKLNSVEELENGQIRWK